MLNNTEWDLAVDRSDWGLWYEFADPRTKSWPLCGSPWPTLAIMTTYFITATFLGPRFMKSRKAFELRKPMLLYNVAMVTINAYFFVAAIKWLRFGRALLDLELPSFGDRSETGLRHIDLFFFYWLTKFVDLLDTIFFVLRKKSNQITTLHLYHHTVVPILGWLGIWFRCTAPGISLFVFLNSAVHVIMYSYYALSAFGPAIQPYLWWKRYITQIQLIQFAILAGYGVLVGPHLVGYPPEAYWIAMTQPPLFFYMFYDFYRQAYQNNKKRLFKQMSSLAEKKLEKLATLETSVEKLIS